MRWILINNLCTFPVRSLARSNNLPRDAATAARYLAGCPIAAINTATARVTLPMHRPGGVFNIKILRDRVTRFIRLFRARQIYMNAHRSVSFSPDHNASLSVSLNYFEASRIYMNDNIYTFRI